MGMAAIFFNGKEPFKQIVNTLFNRESHVKSDENCSNSFREEI